MPHETLHADILTEDTWCELFSDLLKQYLAHEISCHRNVFYRGLIMRGVVSVLQRGFSKLEREWPSKRLLNF